MAMGRPQDVFRRSFKVEFAKRFGLEPVWHESQDKDNKASMLKKQAIYRREGLIRPNEGFELGDLRCDYRGRTIIVEYDSEGLEVHNLLKYWPYLLGELSERPSQPLILCHFSSWHSYGSRRDLWRWLLDRMQKDIDPRMQVQLVADQFDNGVFKEKAPDGKEKTVVNTSLLATHLERAMDFLSCHLPDKTVESVREPTMV
jgi:hypothetical protein